jgi:hypothetical protein
MTQQEFIKAASGSQIGNRPESELKETIKRVCDRIGIPDRYKPKGESLEYMVDQMRRRHNYTIEELYLAVDMYNAKSLNFKLPENQPFSVHLLNAMMDEYKLEKGRSVKSLEYVEQVPDMISEQQNADARREVLLTIYNGIKQHGMYETVVMHLWMIAFEELERQQKVTMAEFDQALKQAREMAKANTYTKGRLILNPSVENYQALIVVDRYMRLLIKSRQCAK